MRQSCTSDGGQSKGCQAQSADAIPRGAASFTPDSTVPNPPPNGRDHADLFAEALHGEQHAAGGAP